MPGPRSLYRVMVPHGSRRDRCCWIALVTIKKLREGPGPWLRAVKKGLYQLLPLAWQRRVLRWTGKDEFFRRGELRHAGAAAGVERPGLVSVVLPVFNQADMLAEAIDSVLAQSYVDLELIVVDDGSTDGVHDVLRRYLGDPRVRAVSQPNQKLPKALSNGFEHAVGEYFTWTSADNRMLPQQLERLVAFLQQRPEVAMVYADYELIDAHGARLVGGEFRVMDRTDKANLSAVRLNRSTHDLNRYEDNFVGACFLYRGQIGRLLGDYNPELGLEDYDYWMRINRLFRIEHLGTDEVLYQYRVHDNTLSARARELKIAERAKLLMQYERERAAWVGAALADGGRLRIETPAALHDLPLTTDGRDRSFACWLASPEQVYAAHAQLRHLPVCAFAADADTAARLAVFTRSVFHGQADGDGIELAHRHAANGTFLRSTREPAQLRRAVPTPLLATQPLRVLLQLDSFGKGGLERVVEDLATCLLADGCEVGVLTLDDSARTALLPDAVRRLTLPSREHAAYEQLLREGGWHAVHAHASTFGAEVAHRLGVPFVQVVHNSYVWFDPDTIARYRTADAHTTAYACVSAQALGYADLRLGLDVQKMLVIENGVASDVPATHTAARAVLRRELGLAADDVVFLQVASLQPAKAHLVAVRALAALREHLPNAKLLCLGNERMNPVHSSRVRAEIARLQLTDAVVLTGHRDDITACYAAADAFLLPSFWEGCSLAVWEAIRHGLPMVLADVGAAREQLQHGRGELVAPPFDSMFALDASNLDALVAGQHDDYCQRLAAAMHRVLATARPFAGLPHVADRLTMARRHQLLLRWLLQGGTVPGVRESVARAACDDIILWPALAPECG